MDNRKGGVARVQRRLASSCISFSLFTLHGGGYQNGRKRTSDDVVLASYDDGDNSDDGGDEAEAQRQ